MNRTFKGYVIRYRQNNNKGCEISFKSTNKYQVSIHKAQDHRDNYLLVMKKLPMTDQCKDAFETTYIELGGLGQKVLGFCDFILPKDKYPTGYPFDSD